MNTQTESNKQTTIYELSINYITYW